MKTLIIKVKSPQFAKILANFLRTLDYVDAVEQCDLLPDSVPYNLPIAMERGNFAPGEKPSDFAGIWKNRKKVDAKKLRKRAWLAAKKIN